MPELKIGLADGGELSFKQSSLQFYVKKKCRRQVLLDMTLNAEY